VVEVEERGVVEVDVEERGVVEVEERGVVEVEERAVVEVEEHGVVEVEVEEHGVTFMTMSRGELVVVGLVCSGEFVCARTELVDDTRAQDIRGDGKVL